MNKKLKTLLIILVLLTSIFVSSKLYVTEDYYNNIVGSIEKIDEGRYEGYATYNLHPGDYNLSFSCNSNYGVKVQVIEIDTASVIKEQAFDSASDCYSVGFTLDSLTKGIKIRIIGNEEISDFSDAYYSSNTPIYNDRIVIIALVLVVCLSVRYLVKNKNNTILILLLIAAFVSIPLISKDLKYGQDLYFHIDRIFNIAVQYGKGYIIPRLSDTSINSFGSITPMTYPELFLYLPGLLVYFNVSVVLAYKLLCIIVNFVTVFIAYFVANKAFNHKAGLIFAFLYTINPYRLNEIFIRAALGELLAMAFIPLAFYGLYLLIQDNYKKGMFVAILGISMVFHSNILATFIFLIFGFLYAFTYVLFNWKSFFRDKKRITYIVFAAILTVCINAYFVIPFLRLQDGTYFVINNRKSLSNHAGTVMRLISDVYNNKSSMDGMSISVGSGTIVGIFAVFLSIIKNNAVKHREIVIGSSVFGLVALLLSSELFPWNFAQYNGVLPDVLGVIQFPWRFQMMTCLFMSLSIAIIFSQAEDNGRILSACILLLCLISGINCMSGYNTNTIAMHNKSDCDNTDINRDYFRMNDSLEAAEIIIQNRTFISNNNKVIFNYSQLGKKQLIEYDNLTIDTSVELPIYYYKDIFEVRINGEATPYECGDGDTILVNISKTQGSNGLIEVELKDTYFIIPNIISCFTIFVVVVLYARYKKEEKLISSK